MERNHVNKFVFDVMFRQNRKASIFQIAVFSIFLIFLFCWEPIAMYCLFAAIRMNRVGAIFWASLFVSLSLFCFATVQYVNNTYADCNSWNIITKIRERLFRSYYALDYNSTHEKFSTGEIFDRIFQSGIGILDYAINYLGIFLMVIMGVGFAVYYAVKIPLVLIPVFLLVGLELFMTKRITGKLSVIEREKRELESLRTVAGERLTQDLEFSLMYGVEDVMLDQYLSTLDKSWNQVKKKEMLLEFIHSVHSFVQSILQILLGLAMFGAKSKGLMNTADTPVMLLVLDKLSYTVKEAIQRISEIGQKRVSVRRILELVPEGEVRKQKALGASPKTAERESPGIVKEAAVVTMNNVSIKIDGYEILKDVNLEVLAGEKVAIIGENGSGKSTLLKAALGLVPANSGICLIHGTDTGKWTYEQRRRVGYIPVTPFLFMESVSSNIDMGIERPDENLKCIADEFCAGFFNNDVETLSGGQQQMVNICRGVLRTPAVLFADEPTSHLQREETERVMKWILENGDTCLVITHDLSLLPLFTRVLEIKEGGLAEISQAEISL